MADKVRLKPEFLRFMEIRDALPTALEVRNWLARHDVAPKSGVMDQLLKGEAVGLSYVVRFVRYIVERHRAGGAGVYYKALCDYLLPIGKDPKSLSHHQIAECLLMTPEANFRYRGTENFIRAVVDHAISFLPPLIFECQPSQVNEAVRWIYVTAGKERARRGATTDSLRC